MKTSGEPGDPDVVPQHGAAAIAELSASLRVVLDTNAVLDWLLFRDKGFAPISAAIESGAVVALTDEPCLEELRLVLRYPEFKLDDARQAELMVQYRRHVRVVEVAVADMADADKIASPGVPRCQDADDQKFLEIASRHAAILVTKDKLLLRLARRVAKGGRFKILRPDLLAQRLLEAREFAPDSSR